MRILDNDIRRNLIDNYIKKFFTWPSRKINHAYDSYTCTKKITLYSLMGFSAGLGVGICVGIFIGYQIDKHKVALYNYLLGLDRKKSIVGKVNDKEIVNIRIKKDDTVNTTSAEDKNNLNVEEKVDSKTNLKIEKRIEEKIQEKIEEKIEQKIGERIQGKIIEKIVEKIEEKVEGKMEDTINEKIEETINEKIEEKIEEMKKNSSSNSN